MKEASKDCLVLLLSLVVPLSCWADITRAAFYEPAFTIIEPDSGGMFGWSLLCDDFDDDGYAEIVIGAPIANSLDGKVYVYDLSNLSLPALIINAPVSRAQIGISLSKLDFDGDGFVDLAVGGNGAYSTGAVFIYRGGSGFDNFPDFILKGQHPADNFGFSVASLGDITGDGKEEIAVGAIYSDTAGYRSGAVYIFLGGDTLPHIVLVPPDSLEDFGACLATCDLDDDSLSDLIVGAPEAAAWLTKPGSIFLYKARSLIDGETNYWKHFSGEIASSSFGGAIAPLTNITGADKIIVGAYSFCPDDICTGRIYIVDSSGVIWNFTGECGNAQLGSSVGSIGDFLLNGYHDWATSGGTCDGDSCDGYQVLIFSGRPDFHETPSVVLCDTATNFGWSILSLPDFIDNPAQEIAIGAPSYLGSGRVMIYSGIWSPNTIYVEIIQPLPNWFVSDSFPRISFIVRSLTEINWASAVFTINGDTVTVSHSGDTLFAVPSTPSHDGDTIIACLVEITSTWNDPFAGPVCTEFLIDLSPPEIIGAIPKPEEQIRFIPHGIAWVLKEKGNLDTSSISIEINGLSVEKKFARNGEYWLIWCQDTFSGHNVYAELSNIKDLPDIGLPNIAENWSAIYNIGRTWTAEIEAIASGKLPQKLMLGQFNSTTAGMDLNYDVLFFPDIQKTSVAIAREGWLLKRDFEPENYVTSWHIVNMETCSVILKWKPNEFPDGSVYINGIPMHRDSAKAIAGGETLNVIADFTNAAFLVTPFEQGWNLLGYCYPECYNSTYLWNTLAEMSPVCLIDNIFRFVRKIPEGYGFWILSNSKGIMGTWLHRRDTVMINLSPGWNIAAPFQNATMVANPPTILPETFGWNGTTFYVEDTAELGKGYYIFTIDSTKLMIIGE